MQEAGLYLFGVLILLLGLAISIGLHEVGHLLPAKLFNVKVLRYMIGFGPTLWSSKKGETEYGIKLIPLGGYVAMTGMYPPKVEGESARNSSTGAINSLIDDAREISNEAVEIGDDARTFYKLPVLKKIVVMLGGPLMNLVLAVVFMSIVISGFGVEQVTTKVQTVSECLVPAGSEITECDASFAQAPAAAAGILPGDEIVSINGTVVKEWSQVPQIISESPDIPIQIEVVRAGSTENLTVVPASNEKFVVDDLGRITLDESGQPITETVGMIGVSPAIEHVRLPLSDTPVYVFDNVKAVANIIINMPERLVAVWNAAFGPDERELDSPISVVGVGRIAGEIVSNDGTPILDKARSIFGLLASLNVALFVFNLVPLPPLDGGHIAGAVYEWSKRSLWRIFGKRDPGPVDTAKMVPVTLAVAAVLIGMTILLIYADLVKPINLFN
ncbi:MAG TPA: site-2 protease family protein [Microbacteriaceae bacterium]|nr:site-2 protease family protein [Microbacteriaceae bacterium]